VILVVGISGPCNYVVQRRPVSGNRRQLLLTPPDVYSGYGRLSAPHANKKGVMDWTIIGVNFLYAALGVVLMWVAYRVFDRLTPEVNFAEELKKGNIAVAIFIAALFIAIALIVGRALN
jgi:hypothetical protein